MSLISKNNLTFGSVSLIRETSFGCVEYGSSVLVTMLPEGGHR